MKPLPQDTQEPDENKSKSGATEPILPQEAELRQAIKQEIGCIFNHHDHACEVQELDVEPIMQRITEHGRKERLAETKLYKVWFLQSTNTHIEDFIADRIAALSTPSEQPNRKDG